MQDGISTVVRHLICRLSNRRRLTPTMSESGGHDHALHIDCHEIHLSTRGAVEADAVCPHSLMCPFTEEGFFPPQKPHQDGAECATADAYFRERLGAHVFWDRVPCQITCSTPQALKKINPDWVGTVSGRGYQWPGHILLWCARTARSDGAFPHRNAQDRR